MKVGGRYMIIDNPHSQFIIKEGIHGIGVFTTIAFKKGEVLFTMEGPLLDKPTRTSVQVGKNKHIEDITAGCINHSCTPNAIIDQKIQSFISIRDIHVGEEISFDYNQNEDILASPFVCACCGKEIFGKIFVKNPEIYP
jgi:hypothetical protein